MRSRSGAFFLLGAVLATSTAWGDDRLIDAIRAIRAVGAHGAGHREAQAAWRELAQRRPGDLPAVIQGIDGANVLAENWFRMAADAIAERALRQGETLPLDALQSLVQDRSHAPRGRRLAYEWIFAAAPDRARSMLSGLLDDPSLELRRDAVEHWVTQAEALAAVGDQRAVTDALRSAFTHARDSDQVESLAKRLEELGVNIDLVRHYGFVTRWKIIGPFDNTGRRGFAAVYPPEQEQWMGFDAAYEGKLGTVRWSDYESKDRLGVVDFNAVIGSLKGVVGYAASDFFSDREQDVQLRYSSLPASKVWLNGELVAEHEIYHLGSALDQYVVNAKFRPGKNRILVKICQNEQTEPWTDVWQFQLRVCDAVGTAVLPADSKQSRAP